MVYIQGKDVPLPSIESLALFFGRGGGQKKNCSPVELFMNVSDALVAVLFSKLPAEEKNESSDFFEPHMSFYF